MVILIAFNLQVHLWSDLQMLGRLEVLPPSNSFRNVRAEVAQFYKTSGWCQKLARSKYFENMTLCLIMVNAVPCSKSHDS